MKIVDVKTETLVYPLDKPFWNGRGRMSPSEGGRVHKARSMVLVRVLTDEGLVGLGEAGLAGAPPAVVASAVENGIKPVVLGEDASQIERLWHKVYQSSSASSQAGVMLQALSGFDIALWDLQGKALGVPVHRLLGTFRDKVPAYASGGFYLEGKGVEELAEEATVYLNAGFKGMKMKVGALRLGEDAARVEAVREALGLEPALMIDANSVYSVKDAIRLAERLEDADLTWFEEPVRADDVSGSARVAAAAEVPIAGYETELSLRGFRDLIERGAVEVAQPDIAWVGGFTGCRRIAALAAAHNMTCSPHCFSSALTTVAALHLLASLPNGGWLEFDRTANALRDDLLTERLAIDGDGFVVAPQKPGLGVELDEDAVAKYRVDGAPRRSRRKPA